MRIGASVLFFLAIFVLPLSAQKRTDVLVMKNGDRMTCEIKSLDGGVLYVELDYVDGTVSINWSKVARIESTRLFIVKTQSGSVHTGSLSTADGGADQPVRIEVAESPGKKVELNAGEVVTIGETSDRFWKRFSGDINLGMTYAKGNQSTQFNVGGSVEYPRDRWDALVTFNSTLSSNTGSDTTTRNQFGIRVNKLLRWNNYFYAGSASLLQSSEQGIDLQSTFAGGVGYYLKNTGHNRISVTGGLGWQRTKYKNPVSGSNIQNTAAAIINTELRLFKFKKTNLNIQAAFLPSISEPGRYYFRINQSYYVKLFSDLSWNISFYGNWDNRPPLGLSGSDYGTSTGVGWTFGK